MNRRAQQSEPDRDTSHPSRPRAATPEARANALLWSAPGADAAPSPAGITDVLWPLRGKSGARGEPEAQGPPAGEAIPAHLQLAHTLDLLVHRLPAWGPEDITSTCQRLRALSSLPGEGGAFTASVAEMLRMSHTIEDHVLARRLGCDMYVSFQRLALLAPQLSRYGPLLDLVRYLFVFGLDDTDGPDDPQRLRHPRLVHFTIKPHVGTGLLWYWCVVIDHPQLQTALLARQTSGYIFNRTLARRTYEGIWTFDAAIVGSLVSVLRDAGRALYYG